MRLPEALRDAIAEEVETEDQRALGRAAAEVSKRYRSGKFSGAMSSAVERAAYLATRVPATYAANAAVIRELLMRVAEPVRSVLDLGTGPGTAMWAAAEVLGDIKTFTAVERDPHLIVIGKRFAAGSSNPAMQNARWIVADLRNLPPFEPHDVVIVSYAMGELPEPQGLVRAAWQSARVALILIEPGTTAGFGHVLLARDMLIASGAQIVAPCPHHNACPLAVRNDWCHFSVRLERTSEHRKLKGGELGYEDEKFSYVIAARSAAHAAAARIVRHPRIHPGHIQLTLCTSDGLQQPTITKSQKSLYRAARKAEWGDAWQPAARILDERRS